MSNRIFAAWLEKQNSAGLALAAASDVLELLPLGEFPASRFIARFHCTGLVRAADGRIDEADSFDVGIHFPSDYQRRVNPAQTLTFLAPTNIHHPNIMAPFICVGSIHPGTGLVDLLYQIHALITYSKVTANEFDALNKAACAWARRNRERFPVDRRPLKRRSLNVSVVRAPEVSS